MPYTQNNSPFNCWSGYKRKPGTTEFSKGSCVKISSSPAQKKQKGGGTTKTCLPVPDVCLLPSFLPVSFV